MSFKLGRFFSLIIGFVTGCFFLVIGSFGIILPWSPYLQQETTEFILANTLMLSLFGLGFALIGLSLVIYSLLATRNHYVMVRTGSLAVAIDEAVISQYLEAYWQEQFPNAQISFHVKFKKEALQIAADLPALPLKEQKIFLEKVKEDFRNLFGRTIGYPHDVHLLANFQTVKSASTRTP